MSGHSKWSKIKRKKGATDAKRSAEFGKIARVIMLAARDGADLSMNSGLKNAIEKAKAVSMPNDNIKRAVERGSLAGQAGGGGWANLESVTYELYGPSGVGIVVETITDNRNRTVSEIKRLINNMGAKLAEPGSVTWAFKKAGAEWEAQTSIPLGEEEQKKLADIIEALEEHDDVQAVYDNFGN